jgi:REP element-mobilizing transposase RayT
MTQPRSQLIQTGTAGTFHCVQRCVRRAFLCGIDDYTGQSFEHRKAWVNARIALIASCFAADVLAYTVMSNHLHIVVHMDPMHVATWSDEAVVERWMRLFPARNDRVDAHERKRQRILEDLPYLSGLRRRLGDLSWLMRCVAEPIARRANAEDGCKGRFWEGRYKCQLLCDTRAVLAAMTYVDLNPIRAGMATRLEDSDHTSIQQRIENARCDPNILTRPLLPTSGSLLRCLPIHMRDYLDLVDWTGRQLREKKRGSIPIDVPHILLSVDPGSKRWVTRVKAIGSSYWRVVGDVQDLVAIAERIGQRWIKGLGLAKRIARPA